MAINDNWHRQWSIGDPVTLADMRFSAPESAYAAVCAEVHPDHPVPCNRFEASTCRTATTALWKYLHAPDE